MIYYELWEYRTRNIVNTYDTEVEALTMVRDLLANGWCPEELALGWGDTDDEERLGPVAEGQALAQRAATAVIDDSVRRSA